MADVQGCSRDRVACSCAVSDRLRDAAANEAIDKMVAAFAQLAPKSTKFQYVPLPDETHATVLHRSLYRAFEFLYGETHPGL